MQAARLAGAGQLRLHDEEPPVPGPGESLVRVGAVGLCGSDLHWWGEGGIGDARLTRPLVLGHEVAGVVEGGPLDGTAVAVDPAVPCEQCPVCRTGHRNLCPDVRFAGHGSTDGGLQELLAWPTARLHPLPAEIGLAGATVLEPLGVALHAMDLAHVRLGASVTVVGCGPIGLLLVQLARLAGAGSVVAVEPLAHRRQAALDAGADAAHTPADLVATGVFTAPDAVPGLGSPGADVVLEVVGSRGAVELAVRSARPGGRVVLVGIPDDDRTAFPASVARRKGLTLAVVRRMGEVYPRAIDLVRRGLVDVDALVTGRYPLHEVGSAFAAAAARTGLKVVVEVSS
ncbi:MAG: alcohol dehydrogenase [Frankiales bacterium]|nr:alcohol dehydrogenase [Frankiales bacterium]